MKMRSSVTFSEIHIVGIADDHFWLNLWWEHPLGSNMTQPKDTAGGEAIFCWSDNETEKNCNEVSFCWRIKPLSFTNIESGQTSHFMFIILKIDGF